MDPILPSPDAILRPALERMYVLRPASFKFINLHEGIYWHPFLGFRAQTAKMLQRLADHVGENRLKTATGTVLKAYVASEYDAVPETGLTSAIGEATFIRITSSIAGDIPKGARLSRRGNLTTQLPLRAADYETLADVHFDVGQLTAGPVAIQAVSSGAGYNHPIRTDTVAHGVSISDQFDATISVSTFSAAGGVDTTDDPYVRRFAKAFAIGQYGPTEAAARLGALSATGVRNLLAYDIPGTGTQQVLVADGTWSSSARWAQLVQQSMYDADLVGHGCKVEVGVVQNKVISLEVTVVLRDINFTRETTEIDLAIRASVKAYLDERHDWNVWKSAALKGAISRAHDKIFNCTSLTMRGVDGVEVAEISSPDYSATQYHYALSNGAVKITYTGPS